MPAAAGDRQVRLVHLGLPADERREQAAAVRGQRVRRALAVYTPESTFQIWTVRWFDGSIEYGWGENGVSSLGHIWFLTELRR